MRRQDELSLPAGPAPTAGVHVAGSPAGGAASLSESVLLEHGDLNGPFTPWLACACVGLFVGIALFVLLFLYKASSHQNNEASYGEVAQTTSPHQDTQRYQPNLRRRRENASHVVTTGSARHDELSKAPTTSDTERFDTEATATTDTDGDRSTGDAFDPGFVRRDLFEPVSPVRNFSSRG
ncbi:hypothetical protein HPB51_010257 [Rhipicephalus microplus]|uniref:Transmembrane protein n=1 Tax=Rhipicephalus microplus TaxID=6941 RepID=A0A9J6D4Q6_RHIMP|nr:hypothetical protein HPB51_010257 [Rhipicephalus microplus]